VVDIRFQQLFAERAQSTPVQVVMALPMPSPTPSPIRSTSAPTSMPVPMPASMLIQPINEEPQSMLLHPVPYPQSQIAEPATRPSTGSSHVRQPSASSSTTLFVLVLRTLPSFCFFLRADVSSSIGLIPALHGHRFSSDAMQRRRGSWI
jgi:hypothetical protein